MFNLSRYFSTLSLILIGLAAGLLGLLYREVSVHQMTALAEDRNVAMAQILRRTVLASGGQTALHRLQAWLGPISLAALLATLILLFGFQGPVILGQPLLIAGHIGSASASTFARKLSGNASGVSTSTGTPSSLPSS